MLSDKRATVMIANSYILLNVILAVFFFWGGGALCFVCFIEE